MLSSFLLRKPLDHFKTVMQLSGYPLRDDKTAAATYQEDAIEYVQDVLQEKHPAACTPVTFRLH